MDKIRVLQIGKYYHPVTGGIEDHLYHFCNDIKERCDLNVLVSNTVPRTEKNIILDVQVTRVSKLGELSNIPVCLTMPIWLRKFMPDIVHFHLPNPMAHLAWFLARPRGRLVITYHSDIVNRDLFVRCYSPFLIALLHRTERIIATSPAYVHHSPFLRRFKSKTNIIPYGIDLSIFEINSNIQEKITKIREKFGTRIVLFVGRLTYYKGLQHLIEAMHAVRGNLIIIGGGKLEKELRIQTQNSKDKDRIWFLGEVPHLSEDLIAFFHACDVFVLPSIERSEAFGIVQLEAMACGKPVVSTDLTTGVPWVNQDGRSGIIVPPRDPKSLATAINTLLENPELRKKYGIYGKERVEKEFTKELVAQRVLHLYREILTNP